MWPGRVQRGPLAPGEPDGRGVVHPHGRRGGAEQPGKATRASHEHPPAERERIPVAAPRRWIPRTVAAELGRLFDVDVRRIGDVPQQPELAVGDDVRAALPPHPAGPAEVVGMAVGDDHRVHPAHGDPGGRQPPAELAEHAATGEPGVDDRRPAFVLEDIAVDVPEAGHVDRQLTAQHPGGDLGDVVGRRLLLLTSRPLLHPRDATAATGASRRFRSRPGTFSGRRAGSCRRWRRPPSPDGPRRPRRAGSGGRSPGAGRRR